MNGNGTESEEVLVRKLHALDYYMDQLLQSK